MTQSFTKMATLVALLVASATMGTVAISAVSAQDESGPQSETLMEFTLDDEDVPSGTVAVRLLRIRLESGARSHLHTHPGPEFNLVTDGTIRATAEGPALWVPRQDAETRGTEQSEAPDGEFIMRRGDAIAYLPGTGMTFLNSGSSEALMLAAVIQQFGPDAPPSHVWIGQAPTEEERQGVSSDVLGDGLTDGLPDGQILFRVEEMTLSAGEPIPAFAGPVLLSLREGALDLTVQSGSVQVSRTADPGPRPEAEAGSAFTLEPGDGVFFPNGMAEAARAEEQGELSLYRMTIAPVEQGTQASPVAAHPGVVEITTPPQPSPTPEPSVTPTPEGTPETEPSGLQEGATVVVTTDGVRIRTGASTDTDIVDEVDTGHVLVITGPSDEGEDYVWWPVEDPNDPAVAGFIAADFIEVQEDDGA